VQSPPADHQNFYELESIKQLPGLIESIVPSNG